MKKLMIAAVAAAVSVGSFAALCDDDPVVTTPDQCEVYNFKMSLTTLVPSKVKCDEDIAVYFKKGKRTVEGILWDCVATCDDTAPASNFVAWEKKAKAAVTAPLTWTGDYWQADALEFAKLDRFGKKAENVEAYAQDVAFEFGDMCLAGIGSYDKKNERVKSVSGYAVGLMTPATYNVVVNGGECEEDDSTPYLGLVLPLCDEFEDWCCSGEEVDQVVAYGTWSIKYNKSLSKGKKRLSQIVPSYAQGE